ncbi:MAG: response regulator, partial [Nitrospirae bacterium]|nr:response regulator [Nitrospirota bacterium]
MMNQILVAEDEPLTRRTLVATLSQDGYTVSEAVDGTQAWHILQSPQAPSLAILDWMMPGLNGIELCQALRNSAGSQNTYLILLTSKGEHKDIVAGLEGGADDYMVKPFDSEELR